MEIVSTTHEIISGNRCLRITKGKNSVDIRITKYADANQETIEQELSIPVTMNTYCDFVNEIFKAV